MKAGDGYKLTVERKKGVEPLSLLAALEEATVKVRAELESADKQVVA